VLPCMAAGPHSGPPQPGGAPLLAYRDPNHRVLPGSFIMMSMIAHNHPRRHTSRRALLPFQKPCIMRFLLTLLVLCLCAYQANSQALNLGLPSLVLAALLSRTATAQTTTAHIIPHSHCDPG